MKYLSSKPFTGGANSRAYVDRWEETFGKPPACDGDGDVAAEKDRIPFTEIDRQITMDRLERRMRQAHEQMRQDHGLRLPFSLTGEEIFSLLLLLEDLREPAPEQPGILFLLETRMPAPLQVLIGAPDTFEGFFRRLFVPWARDAETAWRDIKMLGRVPAGDLRSGQPLAAGQFLGLFPLVNLAGEPRPRFQ